MRALRKLALTSLLLTTMVVWGAEPAPDPFLGKWVLDPQASRYPGASCPRSMVIEMTPDPRGVHYHSETEPMQGRAFQVDYVANYDGKPAIVSGDRGILLPVTLRRDGPHHVIATYNNAFQVVATSDRTVSADGKVMTIVTVSHDSMGQNHTNTGVYRRVVP